MTPPRKVPLLDLRRHGADMDAALRDAFERVLVSGHYILGPEVDALEKECAEYLGVEHALGVSSGTDALVLALMALGIGPGDEVLCPTYTFFASAGAIARVGARPLFVDVEEGSYNATLATMQPHLTERTRAIMPVHLFGQCVDMAPLVEWARAHDLHVIEDAAQALGAETGGRRAGTLGTIGCFSFFPSKNLGAMGDAGLVTTDDDALAQQARIMRAHGGKPKYHHRVIGGNFRIDALQAALLRVKLPTLDAGTLARQRNAARYDELLAGLDGIERPTGTAATTRHIYNQYVIRVCGDGRRDRLRAFLAERGVGTEVYYPIPMHLQECFASLGHKLGDFPVAEAAARETLAIPIFPELEPAEVEYVAAQIRAF